MSKQHDSIRSAVVRLVGSNSPPDRASHPRYRPLIIGAAILFKPLEEPRAPWLVDLSEDDRFRPDAPATATDIQRVVSWKRLQGCLCRVAAALVSSSDIQSRGGRADRRCGPAYRLVDRSRLPSGQAFSSEIYGWSLMVQLPGMHDRAMIDPHEVFADLPAYYDSPLELLDRGAYLTSRGIPNRPIALLTRPEDFIARQPSGTPGGQPGRANRFFPGLSFRRPANLSRLM
ncbi:MAG: hypothetical protein DWH79_09400 [Planctomycetota bacterium]|nr:MAG: hypothetical protein DWH79_09400 [Planctomycetota bacterium]